MRWEWETGENDPMLRSKEDEPTSGLWDPIVGGLQDSCPDLIPRLRDERTGGENCNADAPHSY